MVQTLTLFLHIRQAIEIWYFMKCLAVKLTIMFTIKRGTMPISGVLQRMVTSKHIV